MSGVALYERKYEYQEIHVNSLEDIERIIADYNCFYNLPRQGRSADDDKSVYMQTFFRGQSDESWEIRASIERAKKQEFEIFNDYKPINSSQTILP